MAKKSPEGSTVKKEESHDEFQEKKIASQGKKGGIEAFIKAKKEEEDRRREVTSADLEVIKDVTAEQLFELQGIRPNGQSTGKTPRLYGYDPKTRTACVLKKEFIESNEKKK